MNHENHGYTTYKVYWKDWSGKGFTYIEVSNKYGRRKAEKARRFFKMQFNSEITKIEKS